MSDDSLGMNLHSTMDAVVWAQEFMKINPPIDEDTMRAWFANSIMCGWDHAWQRINKDHQEMKNEEDEYYAKAAKENEEHFNRLLEAEGEK